MIKKLSFLIVITAFFAMKMSAQDYHYGIYLGVGFNNMVINSDLHFDDSEVITTPVITGYDTTFTAHYLPIANAKVDPMASFTVGAYYELPVSEFVGFQLHLLYNRYGYTISGTVDQPNIGDEFSVEYDYKGTLKMSNISASVLLKLNVIENNLSVEAGVTPSYCIKMSKDVERGPLHKTLSYDRKNDYNAFNVCGTVGLTYYMLDVFYASVKANFGLLDVL